jgi:hypothetical protein
MTEDSPEAMENQETETVIISQPFVIVINL